MCHALRVCFECKQILAKGERVCAPENPLAERFLTFSVLLLECAKRSLNPAEIGVMLAMTFVLDLREPSQLVLGYRTLARRRRWCIQTSKSKYRSNSSSDLGSEFKARRLCFFLLHLMREGFNSSFPKEVIDIQAFSTIPHKKSEIR